VLFGNKKKKQQHLTGDSDNRNAKRSKVLRNTLTERERERRAQTHVSTKDKYKAKKRGAESRYRVLVYI
jgi:transposase